MDGLRSFGKVGSVHRLEAKDIKRSGYGIQPSQFRRESPSQFAASLFGRGRRAEIVVIGAEVSLTLRLSDRLTPVLAASLNETVERIIHECMS